MATYAQFKHVELYKIGHGKNRVPNAPKSCIAEIFSSDVIDSKPLKNGTPSRPRLVRDTPTRPRDTHSRLFGQGRAAPSPVAPMVTDTIRSNIKFGEPDMNGISPSYSPSKLANGSAASTPSRGEPDLVEHSSYSPPKRNPVTGDGVVLPRQRRPHPAASQRASYSPPKRNPVTGDGVVLPRQRRPHPAASQRGADSPDLDAYLLPQPTHRYITHDWPPKPAQYYVESSSKSTPNIRHNPYTLLGIQTDVPEKVYPIIDPDSLSPQLVLDKHWPPFPARHYLEPSGHTIPHHTLPPHAFVGITSALGDRPKPEYKYNPIPSLDGPIDPYLIANSNPPPTLFKYERDGPIPDFTPLETPLAPGPHTLTGFPPTFHKHVPGYLYDLNRHAEDFRPKTYYVDYARQREMEGNPITGDGYKSINGQINTVTSLNGTTRLIHPTRVPPGGHANRLW